ncbi:MAG TPA: hypothetical protein VLU41_07135 [Ideonella sp.]|nr:hypothetical protein [Ideonella sp.]
MSNVHHLHLRPRDRPAVEALPEGARRALAIDFLASDRSMAELVDACTGAEAASGRATLDCVLTMVREDAPQELILVDPRLYRRLRERITDIRLSGWIAPPR